MAPVVYTPVEGFTGTVVGVHFRDGAGETDDPAALGYFQSAGYRIESEVAPAGAPLTADEAERAAEATATPENQADAGEESDAEESGEGPKRPYPQANKGEWLEYLDAAKPGHGLSVDNTKAELIAAAG